MSAPDGKPTNEHFCCKLAMEFEPLMALPEEYQSANSLGLLSQVIPAPT